MRTSQGYLRVDHIAAVREATVIPPAHYQDGAMFKRHSEKQMCIALPSAAQSWSCCIASIHEASQQNQRFQDPQKHCDHKRLALCQERAALEQQCKLSVSLVPDWKSGALLQEPGTF